ncbi:hypothetical protein AB1Y20_007943 [Prymnesium parvum]|uniref:Regulatory protein SIR2 homolog 7 n=1 Tax=Prymnesium parvum TaxID=97485 RepID=A0AB34ISZ2_PRYPA
MATRQSADRRSSKAARPAAPTAADTRRKKVALLARLMRNAAHCVVVTGAGVSTNAGLRDYRGPNGIWTEAEARGEVVGEPGAAGGATPWDEAFYRLMPSVQPTLTHRSLTALVRAGVVKHVVTQNEDGLHRRAGMPAEALSELHGSAFVELCGKYEEGDSDSDLGSSSSSGQSAKELKAAAKAKALSEAKAAAKLVRQEIAAEVALAKRLRPAGCGAQVVRDFVTYYPDTYLRSNPYGRHVTGRVCPRCRAAAAAAPAAAGGGAKEGAGWLVDSTVDFGETPGGFPWGKNSVHRVEAAKAHMQLADLVVVWGSSLSVLANYFDPWCPSSKWAAPPPRGLRKAAAAGGKKRGRDVAPCLLAIVGRGKVLDEEMAVVKIEEDVDIVAEELLSLLGMPPPPPYSHASDPLLLAAEQPFEGEPAAPWRICAVPPAGGSAEESADKGVCASM